jgi:hypothetical protein
MKSQKVKNILFKMKIKGNGIVNYDSSEQKYMYKNTELWKSTKSFTDNNNVSYAKKSFYETPEGIETKIKISSNCLRHEIFADDVKFQSPNIAYDEFLTTVYIASPGQLLRGYTIFTKNEICYKRKSPLSITSAEQTNGAMSHFEIQTSSAAKNNDKDKETADSTLFFKEVVGDIEYEATGCIDLSALQFVSCDQIFDRHCFNPDMFNEYKKLLKSKLPSFDSELGYFQMMRKELTSERFIATDVNIPEYGYKLSDTDITKLVKSLFKRIATMSIQRSNAHAQTVELQYKMVYDPIEDTIYSEDGWSSIKSESDIDAIVLDIPDFYTPQDKEEAIKQREGLKNEYNNSKNKKSELKKLKSEQSKKPKTDE